MKKGLRKISERYEPEDQINAVLTSLNILPLSGGP